MTKVTQKTGVTFTRAIEMTSLAGRMDSRESARMSKSLAAQLLIEIVNLSGCNDPSRVAVAHLTTLLAAIRLREIGNHQADETLANRLQVVNNFPGGDPEIVQGGLLLLELLSLNDHKQDLAEDIRIGKQNPLIVDLDFETERIRILNEYNELSAGTRAVYQPMYDKVIKAGFWA